MTQTAFEPVFVARQPIFDRKQAVWGYELLFRSSQDADKARFLDGTTATSMVIANGFDMVRDSLPEGKKLFVNFPREMLVGGLAQALCPERMVVEILESVDPDPATVHALEQLKASGYTLALDDFVGQAGFEPFLELADIVKVDVLGMDQDRVRRVAEGLKAPGRMLLAEKVESFEVFRQTRELGFGLFQGFFFQKPEVIPGRGLSPSQMSRLRLLQEIGRPEIDRKGLCDVIQSDVSLSYRLLRHINSPGMGMSNQVRSIEHAMNLLGERPLVKWLRILILADLNPTPRGKELVVQAAQRGRFLQLLAHETRTPFPEEGMFLLGLFSLLDAILDLPADQALRHLPLDPALAGALLGRDVANRAWLDLTRAAEQADWPRVREVIQRLGLDGQATAQEYAASMAWAQKLTEF